MVATRGRTFKRPWRRSCLSSKLKSSSAPIGRKDSWCFHAVGSSNAPLLGSTAAEGLPRIGRTSIATRWRSCGLPQSASCSENFVIPPDVFGQTLNIAARIKEKGWKTAVGPTNVCVSMCALVWLAGHPRYWATDSKIGFHGVYQQGDLKSSASGNAVVGAYLRDFGLSFNDIRW